MRLGPVEEHFTAVSALRESRQFGIRHSANAPHVFICSNDLKSTDITSILITCVCAPLPFRTPTACQAQQTRR